MPPVLVVLLHTLREARRRRVIAAALIFAAVFLLLFGIAFHFIHLDISKQIGTAAIQKRMMLIFFVMVGLYGVNFLTLMTAVLAPVDTLSGEIASGVMQTLASKPIRRSEILLGKWLAWWIVVAGYLALTMGGVLLVARAIAGVVPPHTEIGFVLMLLEATVLLTLALAWGTRLGTLANGIVVLGFYGLGFLGGWVEQIGTIAGNDTARRIGTFVSLIVPSESMWQLAAWHMQPSIMRETQLSPFSPASVPTPAMVLWAGGYVLVAMTVALRSFARRPL